MRVVCCCSECCSRVSHLWDLKILLGNICVDFLVIEARSGWSDTVSLSHLEVLSKVLVSAPPVGHDHTESLVSSNLMEVWVSNIVLLSLNWESSVTMTWSVHLVDLTYSVSPVLNHSFLLYIEQTKVIIELISIIINIYCF